MREQLSVVAGLMFEGGCDIWSDGVVVCPNCDDDGVCACGSASQSCTPSYTHK